MSVNACIYDSRNVLAGCITDSVVEHFKMEFDGLRKKYFGDVVTPLLGIMEKALIQSVDKKSADFLNCLKLLSRKYRDDAPIGFVQEVSRSYHNLVRYCCSQAVYDEVLQETIEQFRSVGLEYVSGNSQGFDQEYCQFEYNGKKVSVRMRNRDDLYRMWNPDDAIGTEVRVQDGADEYAEMLPGSPMDVAEATIEFIVGKNVPDDDEALLGEIIRVIGELAGIDD